MKYMKWLILAMMLLAGLLAACTGRSGQYEKIEPAHLEPIDGTDYNRITLTERAAQRLDIHTAPIAEQDIEGASRLVLPYAALIYDINGDNWVYVSHDPLTFSRAPVNVDYIDGDMVILFDGPEPGTQVATVGVAELYGTDTGVGK